MPDLALGDTVWFWSRTRTPYYVEGVIVGRSADGHHALVEVFGTWWFRRLVSMDRLTKVVDAEVA